MTTNENQESGEIQRAKDTESGRSSVSELLELLEFLKDFVFYFGSLSRRQLKIAAGGSVGFLGAIILIITTAEVGIESAKRYEGWFIFFSGALGASVAGLLDDSEDNSDGEGSGQLRSAEPLQEPMERAQLEPAQDGQDVRSYLDTQSPQRELEEEGE